MSDKDPTNILSVKIMLDVVKDSKILTKTSLFKKYQNQVRPSHVVHLKKYIERLYKLI